jgi:hypothetical protein
MRARALALVATLAGLTPWTARARVEVVASTEVLARHVVADKSGDARLVFGGRSWELVLDPMDPAVSPLSDGAFHPMDAGEVESALRDVDGVLPDATILVLPFPRRDVVESSCEGAIVFLAPGIRPVQREHLHATVVHELGHVVENALCPDGSATWSEYLSLRGLAAPNLAPGAPHRDRAREIFAEDFRSLRGGALATSSGAIENPNLPLPRDVAGLPAWFENLLAGAVPVTVASGGRSAGYAAPNPFRAADGAIVTVRLPLPAGGASAEASVFDAAGRRLRTLRGRAAGAALELDWDGTDGGGRRVTAGIYFVKAPAGADAVQVHILR